MPAWLRALKYKSVYVLVGLMCITYGCIHNNTQLNRKSRPNADANALIKTSVTPEIKALQHALMQLGPSIDKREAFCLALAAYAYPQKLAAEYRLTRPPLFHNILVNIGLRDRGLCIHWTKDLLLHFKHLKMKSFQFHWGVAHQGNLFREHSSVVVTGRGRSFDEGIVLDAWRNSGQLFWGPVKGDEYPWKKWGIQNVGAVYGKRNMTFRNLISSKR